MLRARREYRGTSERYGVSDPERADRIGPPPLGAVHRRRACGGCGVPAARAQASKGEEREILLQLEDAEKRHEQHWIDLLGGEPKKLPKARMRDRLTGWMAGRFDSVFTLAMAQQAEARSPYDADPWATPAMRADEKIHHEVVRGLAAKSRRKLSGTFRAAVFGANDGLVSNLALVMGIGATGAAPQFVLFSAASPACWPGRCRWGPGNTSRCAVSANCWRRRSRATSRTRTCQTSTSTRTSSPSCIGPGEWQGRRRWNAHGA